MAGQNSKSREDTITRGESLVLGRTSQGAEIRATLLWLTRHQVAFEIYSAAIVLRKSEVLSDFKIIVDGWTVYSGRVVVTALVNVGMTLVCEAGFRDPVPEAEIFQKPLGPDLSAAYEAFFQNWQEYFRIGPQFKVLVADVSTFLTTVRQWLEQVEFQIRSRPNNGSFELEREALEQVAPRIINSFNEHHERFEEMVAAIPQEFLDLHQEFVRQHWHRLFLSSPFGFRTYHKPLGYAGDYEMMNMIYRNQPEGGSLFEKLIHLLLISQWPARSVRNRFSHIADQLINETSRVVRQKRRARIMTIGCGPVQEIQEFMKRSSLSNEASFTLLDFNQEALDHAAGQISKLNQQLSRNSEVETRRVSVHQLLRRRTNGESLAPEQKYDLIYCTGLFDYLSGKTCRALVHMFYDSLNPGGLVVVANMNDTKPFRYFIEFVLDWRLFYRGPGEMWPMVPEQALESTRLVAEDTSVNLFLHVRRPD